LRENWHSQDYGQQQRENGAVFHFKFPPKLGEWGATPGAFRRDFDCVINRSYNLRKANVDATHASRSLLRKAGRISGLHFYKQFACQMPGYQAWNASAFFSYILYPVFPAQRTPPSGNFGAN
jgi:hypothetical protein